MIEYDTRDGTAVITIDRPEARNAVNPEVATGIEAAVDRAEADPAVATLVLTGTPPVFCAGADLKSIGAGRAAELSTERGGFAGLGRRERGKPLIAAVDGAALAGGMEIVLACDLVVASSDASFGLPEPKRGLIAGAGGLFRLAQRLPRNVAMACALTGDRLDAATAHRYGLVNELCEPGAALVRALELAARINANAPLAVRESRAILAVTASPPEDAGWTLTDAAMARILATADVQEGVRAFVEKRPPSWRGA